MQVPKMASFTQFDILRDLPSFAELRFGYLRLYMFIIFAYMCPDCPLLACVYMYIIHVRYVLAVHLLYTNMLLYVHLQFVVSYQCCHGVSVSIECVFVYNFYSISTNTQCCFVIQYQQLSLHQFQALIQMKRITNHSRTNYSRNNPRTKYNKLRGKIIVVVVVLSSLSLLLLC